MLPKSATLILLTGVFAALLSVPSYSASPDYRQSGQPAFLSDASSQASPGMLTGDTPGSAGAQITPAAQSGGQSSPPSAMPGGDAPPGAFLQGRVTVLGPGTHFRCQLDNTLDTTYTREGEEFQATVTEPVILNGQVAVPPGSKLTGQVTKVISPKNFSFGVNGRIDVKFVSVQTPDGRKFPINASIDVRLLRAAGGANQNPGGRTLNSMKRGAMQGVKYGAGAGALYGMATSRSKALMRGSNSVIGRGLKMGAAGALAGTVIGAGAGLVSSGIKKGSEVHVPIGTNLPVQLDEALTMDATNSPPAVQQPAFGGYPAQQPVQQSYNGYSQPMQQPPQQSYSSYPQPNQPMQQPYSGYPQPNQQPMQQQYGNYPQQTQQPYGGYPQAGGYQQPTQPAYDAWQQQPTQ